MTLLAQDSWEFFLQLMRGKGVTPFPHINILPDQMLLTNSHATHDTDADGLSLDPALCANITLHSNSSLFGILAVGYSLLLLPRELFPTGNKITIFLGSPNFPQGPKGPR